MLIFSREFIKLSMIMLTSTIIKSFLNKTQDFLSLSLSLSLFLSLSLSLRGGEGGEDGGGGGG